MVNNLINTRYKYWTTKKLKEVCTKVTDGSHNPPKKQELGEIMLSAKDVYDGEILFGSPRYLTKEDFKKENKRTDIKPGDVLLTIVGAIGRSAVVANNMPPFVLQRSVAVIKPKEEIGSKFLSYYLRCPKVQNILYKTARGVAQKGIYLGLIKEIEVVVPDKAEQEGIVSDIETQFTRLDAAIKSLKAIKEKLELYRGSILKAAFFNKLLQLDCEWNNSSVKQIAIDIQYGLTSQSGMQFNGSKYLRITDIQNRKVDWERVPYAKEKDRLPDYKLNENDLVFARTGATVGKSFLIKECPEDAVFASYLIRIVPDTSKIVPELLWYYFQSPMYWHDISKSQRGIGQPNVNGKILSGLMLNIPMDLKAQELLVQDIESRFSVIDKIGEVVNNSLRKTTHLRKSILKAAFEGKLVNEERVKAYG